MRKRAFTLLELVAAILICCVLAAVFFPVVAQHGGSKKSPCLTAVKHLALDAIMYASDSDDVMPRAASWMDDIWRYSGNGSEFREVEDYKGDGYGYALRAEASGIEGNKVAEPSSFILVFDSTDRQRNASGGLTLLPAPGRHGGWDHIAFFDGHAKPLNLSPLDGGLEEQTEALLKSNARAAKALKSSKQDKKSTL